MCKVAESLPGPKPEIPHVLDAYVRKHYEPDQILGLEFNLSHIARLIHEHLKEEISLDSVCRKGVLMAFGYNKERCMILPYVRTTEDEKDKVVREQKESTLKALLQMYFNSSELYTTPRCNLFAAVPKQ